MPPPEPPSVNEGRMTTGYPPPPAYAAICAMSACTASASSSECARPDNADVKPIRVMALQCRCATVTCNGLREFLPVFSRINRLRRSADQLNGVSVQDALPVQF